MLGHLGAAVGAGNRATGRPGPDRAVRTVVNLVGAAGAALFARATLLYYLHTHRLVGVVFLAEQAWFVLAFLIRRPAREVARGPGAWLLAAAGTFGGLLYRPAASELPGGPQAGLVLQVAGLALAIVSLLALGRSFGFVAADRGLVTRGPYAVVRHPVYAAYLVIQAGYVLEATTWRNVVVLAAVTACNAGRALAEERVLARSPAFAAYQRRVRFRLIPFAW